ncbi:MAG: hypothetical protein HY397_03440 [Candidatus Doudnabacteria bacterium]|nr:hypothetical protein [Candidatus Doudnabacteria bacterium]
MIQPDNPEQFGGDIDSGTGYFRKRHEGAKKRLLRGEPEFEKAEEIVAELDDIGRGIEEGKKADL